MNTSQGNPFRQLLTDDQVAVLDGIRSRSISRFGFDAFRMEGEGTGGEGQQGGQSGEQNTSGAGSAGGETAGQSGEQAGQKDGQSEGQQKASEKVEDLPEWAQNLIKNTRGEAAENRTKANAAEKKLTEQLDGIAKALGLKGEEKPDPTELAKQLEEQRDAARSSAIELAVYRMANKHKGDPDALLDSRGFLAKLTDLDPSAKDFAAKVETAIKDAVKDNPKLASAQAAGSSSADHAGGSGQGGAPRKPKSMADAVASTLGT